MKFFDDVLQQQQRSLCLMSLKEETSTLPQSWTPDTSFLKIVEVWWHDAETSGGPGWVDSEDAVQYMSDPLPLIKSVGFLCNVTDQYVALTDNVNTNATGGITKIPVGMIKDIYYLERTQHDPFNYQQ